MIHGKPHHKSIKLYQYLVEAFLLSGGGDQSNQGYYAKQNHKPTFNRVKQAVKAAQCPKLASFETFKGCGYRKDTNKCNEPAFLSTCPLPSVRHETGGAEPHGVFVVFLPPGCGWWGLLRICDRALWTGPASGGAINDLLDELHQESHDHCQCRPEARPHGVVVPLPDRLPRVGLPPGRGRT